MLASNCELKVVLDDIDCTIRDLDKLKAGETIKLNSTKETPVQIRAGDTVLATGKVGKSGDRLAVRLAS